MRSWLRAQRNTVWRFCAKTVTVCSCDCELETKLGLLGPERRAMASCTAEQLHSCTRTERPVGVWPVVDALTDSHAEVGVSNWISTSEM